MLNSTIVDSVQEKYLEKLPERIKERMKKCGLPKQKDLAERTGLSEQQISKIMKGRASTSMRLETALVLAEALCCSVDHLTGHDDYSTHDVHGIAEFTGLSGDAVEKISEYTSRVDYISDESIINNGDWKHSNTPCIIRRDYKSFIDIIDGIICSPDFLEIMNRYQTETDVFNQVEIVSEQRSVNATVYIDPATSSEFIPNASSFSISERNNELYYNDVPEDTLKKVVINGLEVTDQIMKQALLRELQDSIEKLFAK